MKRFFFPVFFKFFFNFSFSFLFSVLVSKFSTAHLPLRLQPVDPDARVALLVEVAPLLLAQVDVVELRPGSADDLEPGARMERRRLEPSALQPGNGLPLVAPRHDAAVVAGDAFYGHDDARVGRVLGGFIELHDEVRRAARARKLVLLGRRQRHALAPLVAGRLPDVDAEVVAVGELEGLDVLERGLEVEDEELGGVVVFGGGRRGEEERRRRR